MLVVIVTEDGRNVADGLAIGINCVRDDIGNGKSDFRVALTGVVEDAVPVGRRVDIREASLGTRAEHDALDAFHGSKEYALSSLLAVDENLYHPFRHAEHCLDVVDLTCFIFAHSTVAGTALTAHDALIGQLNTRAGNAVGIEEFYL